MSELLQPGQVFGGRYRVEKLLAEGGMGAVYVAEHTSTEAHVALKVLWPHVLGSRDAVSKFEVEAKIAARVNSEHIVRVLDAGYDEQTSMPFLVMELLRGESLEALVLRQGPLSPAEAAATMQQVAIGLDRAHGHVAKDGTLQPIVHRDLKPENVFATRRDNGELLVKILDFGIAKVLSQGTKLSREVKGTPLYMAFEQAAGEAITPRTDVWAFGLIAFFLLAGKPYWRAGSDPDASLASLMGEVLSLPLVSPCQRAEEIGAAGRLPPAFDAWFFGCVSRDPSKRFASAGEAAVALTGLLLGPEAAASWSSARTVQSAGSALGQSGAPVIASSSTAAGTRDGLALSTNATNSRRGVGVLIGASVAVFLVIVTGFAVGFRMITGGSAAGASPGPDGLVVASTPQPSAMPSSAVVPSAAPAASPSAPVVASTAGATRVTPASPATAVTQPAKTAPTTPAKTGPSKPATGGVYDAR